MADQTGAQDQADRDPRALVATIYGKIHEIRQAGAWPGAVVMSLADFKLIAWYRALLGASENATAEYLGDYQIFGLPVYCENVGEPEVRVAPVD